MKEEQVSFLGTPWPAVPDHNVLGQPLKAGRATYDRGIGVHTQSTLIYDLKGGFETLSLRVGMDDSAIPNGEANASVTIDGKVLWQTAPDKPLKAGEAPRELTLDVKKGGRLELHADPAGKLDVQGRVDWLNVALLRP
jgi:hypothetical protein